MIKTIKVNMTINRKNIDYYINKGYECELKDIIEVDSIDISKGSHKKVLVVCEICGSERELFISKYWINHDRYGFYSCKKCSSKKRGVTNLKKYGVENISQTKENRLKSSIWMSSDEFNMKTKDTINEKYGVDHYSKTDIFKDNMRDLYDGNDDLKNQSNKKRIKTCNEKYGVDHYMMTDDYLEKRSVTMNELYGATYSTQSDILKGKIRKSFQENLGVNSPFESKIIQDKSNKTILEKYGVVNVFMDNGIKELIKITNLEKYGYIYPMSSDIIKNKVRKTKVERGLQSDNISDFKIYRNKVSHLTKINKKQLLENWDGLDYYDGEYIKENFKLNHLDKKYPTIDHKKSVLDSYNNGISEKEVSDISNLCITKRSINSSKGSKSEEDFKNPIS